MPRFLTHHVRDQYTHEEWQRLEVAIRVHAPCDMRSCKCERLSPLPSFGAQCSCFRMSGQAYCGCSLTPILRDERFIAYLLAHRRNLDSWHVGDRAEDAEPLLEGFAEALGSAQQPSTTYHRAPDWS